MNVLPRLLFLFSMIPLSPYKTFFKDMNSITTKFIWNNRRPIIKLKTLQRSPAKGGLAFPITFNYISGHVSCALLRLVWR